MFDEAQLNVYADLDDGQNLWRYASHTLETPPLNPHKIPALKPRSFDLEVIIQMTESEVDLHCIRLVRNSLVFLPHLK